jgi:hypothetical protein
MPHAFGVRVFLSYFFRISAERVYVLKKTARRASGHHAERDDYDLKQSKTVAKQRPPT